MPHRRSLSVQSKLLVSFVLLTIAGITVLTGVGYLTARQSLTASAERQLLGLQRSKAGIVKSMLTSMRNEVLAFSATDVATRAAVALRAAHRTLEHVAVTPKMTEDVTRFHLEEFEPAVAKNLSITPTEGSSLPTSPAEWYLHYHYLVQAPKPYGASRLLASATDTSRYGAALGEAQARLGPSIKRLGFENVLFVDPETLDVFYSYEESAVLGTNLASGPYATSNFAALARTLSASKDVDDYRVADFEAYRPKLGAPGAFIGSPVFDGPRLVAVMLLRFRLEPISDALSGGRQYEAEGLGRTGQVYMVGPDLTMRTDSRFLIEDPEAFIATLRQSKLTSRTADTVERLNTTILTVPVDNEATRAALRGQSGVVAIEDYRGVDALMAYGPIDLDSLRWAVIAKIDRQEAMAPLTAYTRRALAVGGALALLASVIALFMAAALTRPIAALVSAARRVSKGTLDVQVDVAPDDEYRELGEAFNEMVRSLRASREDLDRQVEENERLLQSLLPASAAAQVRGGTSETPQSFADVTVAYINLVGLDALSRELGEDRVMALLSDVVGALDEAAEQQGVEKVRTIGASYLAASGLSLERPDHTARMVEFAREAVRIVRRFNAERQTSLGAEIRINAGPVIGGLIGRRKFIYDLWGDTVRLTRRIESDGRTSIIVTRPVYDRVRDMVPFASPTQMDVQGIGAVELFAVILDEGVA
jgi:class 3 adenylate cyclase